jgi:hypothetical protein
MSTGLDGHHRDKNGEISRKHGNTLIGTCVRSMVRRLLTANPTKQSLQTFWRN